MRTERVTHKTFRKDDTILLRVASRHKRLFAAAAARSGLTMSSWIVERALRASADELGKRVDEPTSAKQV